MKRILQFLYSLALFSLLTTALGQQIADKTGMSPLVAIGLTAVFFTAAIIFSIRAGVTRSGMKSDVAVEIWVKYILERFWKDNTFLKNVYSDDQYVLAGQVVHIPQRGSKPNIVKNRNSYPGTIVRRTDTDVFYTLDNYTTDPTQITNAEQVQISYDKISSVLDDHLQSLNMTVADDLIIKWLTNLPFSNILQTSGGDNSLTTQMLTSGQTGSRLTAVHQDLKRVRLLFNLANVPGEDRYALIEENMFDQITDSLNNTQYRDFSQVYDPETGTIGKLYGFNLMTRSSVATAAALTGNDPLSVNALGAATAATDNTVSLFWQKNALTRALGTCHFYERQNDPEYYGDIYSAELRAGGRVRRSDFVGVVALVQGTPAAN